MALCEKTDNDIRSCLNTLQVSWCWTEERKTCLRSDFGHRRHCLLNRFYVCFSLLAWIGWSSSGFFVCLFVFHFCFFITERLEVEKHGLVCWGVLFTTFM